MIGRTLGACLDSAACPICHSPTSLGARRRSPLFNHNRGSPTGRSATHLGILGWETFWRYQDDQQRAMSGREGTGRRRVVESRPTDTKIRGDGNKGLKDPWPKPKKK